MIAVRAKGKGGVAWVRPIFFGGLVGYPLPLPLPAYLAYRVVVASMREVGQSHVIPPPPRTKKGYPCPYRSANTPQKEKSGVLPPLFQGLDKRPIVWCVAVL